MAYRETTKSEELKTYLKGAEFFWNITADVGWGCTNHWADVMLVQYLLGTVLDWREMSPKIDGAFGPKTNKILKLVQKDFLRMRGEGSYGDGKVDTIDGTRKRSTITHSTYTIICLNSELQYRQPVFYSDITLDGKMPGALRSELSRVVISDGVVATIINSFI